MQQQRHELHVYYHRSTPQPPSTSAAVVEEEDDEEEEEVTGAQSMEMEFPSGYSDPWPDEDNEVCACVHWWFIQFDFHPSLHYSTTSIGRQ